MKPLLNAAPLLLCTVLVACTSANSRYIDLNSGKAVEKDPNTGRMIVVQSKEPVAIYVDTQTQDTIDNRSGKVINGHVVKKGGVYTYHKQEESSSQGSMTQSGDGDAKVKRTDDEYKVKRGDYKKEVEKDGDITIKTGDKKIKIDGETGERKVKKD